MNPDSKKSAPSTKPVTRSYWARVEAAGETLELGMRMIWGLGFACLFTAFGWWLGSEIWIGLGVLAAIVAFPIGCVVGFFWLEVKFAVQLVLKAFLG